MLYFLKQYSIGGLTEICERNSQFLEFSFKQWQISVRSPPVSLSDSGFNCLHLRLLLFDVRTCQVSFNVSPIYSPPLHCVLLFLFLLLLFILLLLLQLYFLLTFPPSWHTFTICSLLRISCFSWIFHNFDISVVVLIVWRIIQIMHIMFKTLNIAVNLLLIGKIQFHGLTHQFPVVKHENITAVVWLLANILLQCFTRTNLKL